MTGGDDGHLRGRIEGRRRQGHDREVPGLVSTDGISDAVFAIVADLKDFLKKYLRIMLLALKHLSGSRLTSKRSGFGDKWPWGQYWH